MNPLATTPRARCPFCLRSLKLRVDGKLPRHKAGRIPKNCLGSEKAKAHAENLKNKLRAESGLAQIAPDEVRPEDLF